MKRIALALVLTAAVVPPSFAQVCLHDTSEQASQQRRRQQALQVAERINLAQLIAEGPMRRQRKYRPLDELRNVPPIPSGFLLNYHTDGDTYTFSLKDTLDPCHYAIFSDQDKRLYEATPRTGPILIPATP